MLSLVCYEALGLLLPFEVEVLMVGDPPQEPICDLGVERGGTRMGESTRLGGRGKFPLGAFRQLETCQNMKESSRTQLSASA